jgi:uncharacterized membrane protein
VPSLLPRSPLFQALISAVSFVVGWGLGSAVGWLVHQVVTSRLTGAGEVVLWRRWQPWSAVAAAMVAVLVAVVGSALWLRWQNQQRTVVGPDEVLGLGSVGMMWVVFIVVVAVLLFLGRLLAYVVMRIDDEMPRRLSPAARHTLTVVGVTATVTLLGYAVVVAALVPLANSTFGAADAKKSPGLPAPQTAGASGGPGSLVSWSTLGGEGRLFTATALSTDDLHTLRPAAAVKPPIRVYVGLQDAPDAAARADLAVRELERTGGFQRRTLVVWTVTGTGWVDPGAAAGIEYVGDGDTAIVAQQYSFLPSWISFLVDKDKASEAGRTLYDAVHRRWEQLPAASRPRLVVFGESLGSFGSEAMFAADQPAVTLAAARSAADAVLWVGPTHDNAVWQALVASRPTGTPVWAPTLEDGSMRVAPHASALVPGQPTPKVLWVQHPSDPVGWWSWSTLWSKPAWMSQPTGDDVPREPSWFPLVSWLQATVDLINGFSASPGHGHNYDPDFARAWVTLTGPSDWTTDDTTRLEQALLRVTG